MYQKVDGKWLEVVDFDTMPELPITGRTQREQTYRDFIFGKNYPLGSHPWGSLAEMTTTITYAQALSHAIETGIITEPGKYGIELKPNRSYVIHKIIEE